MPLKVLGAGHGRTGTMSLKLALNELGLGPCYHMTEVFANGTPHIQMWIDAEEGKPVDWHKLFEKYNSSTDFPAAAFFVEILKAFPDAKVILTVRDPEQWYASALESIFEISLGWHGPILGAVLPPMKHLRKMLLWFWNVYPFKGQFKDKEKAIALYHAHNERVKSLVPPSQLLIYDVKQGWEPLCKFLNVPVPSTPFPRVNERAEFRRRILGMRIAASVVVGAGAALVGGLAYYAYSHLIM